MLFLSQNGFSVVAHDRRGHGRSSQASSGNDMNGYADYLAAVIETLDLKKALKQPESFRPRQTAIPLPVCRT